MIAYRHPELGRHPDLNGFRALLDGPAVCQQIVGEWHVCGVCDPLLWTAPGDDADWRQLADGWQVCETGPTMAPALLARVLPWCRIAPVDDARGRAWMAPAILGRTGARAYAIAYGGPDFLPQPTPDQASAEAIAREAREIVLRSTDDPEAPGVTVAIGCRWTACLLALTHHLSVPTIAALGLVDDRLVRSVLHVATGLDARLAG